MSAHTMIFTCSVFLVTALLVGWSAGGLLFPSTPLERVTDILVVATSLAAAFAIYQYIAD